MAVIGQILKSYTFNENGHPTIGGAGFLEALAFLEARGVNLTENYLPVACEMCGHNTDVLENLGPSMLQSLRLTNGDTLLTEVFEYKAVLLRYDSFAAGEATLFAPWAQYCEYNLKENCTCDW